LTQVGLSGRAVAISRRLPHALAASSSAPVRRIHSPADKGAAPAPDSDSIKAMERRGARFVFKDGKPTKAELISFIVRTDFADDDVHFLGQMPTLESVNFGGSKISDEPSPRSSACRPCASSWSAARRSPTKGSRRSAR
jgi:hypothetical protein